MGLCAYILTLLLCVVVSICTQSQSQAQSIQSSSNVSSNYREFLETQINYIDTNYKSIVSEEYYNSLKTELLRIYNINNLKNDNWLLPTTTKNYYCSSSVQPGEGSGTINNPWCLYDTLEGKNKVDFNSTINIRGGVYKRRPKERIDLNITGNRIFPVIIKPFKDERVILDGGIAINYEGTQETNISNVWICGLEITISEPMHTDGSNNITRPSGGIWFAGGDECKIINCIIHGVTLNGISLWTPATNTEVYGNIVYNNGSVKSDRAHGHAIYTQNKSPSSKTYAQNILVAGPNGFTKTLALQAYGSSRSDVDNIYVSENVFLGRVIVGKPGSGSNRISYIKNYQDLGGFDLGYLSDENGIALYRDNIMVGGSISIPKWRRIISRNNKIVANNPNRYITPEQRLYNSVVNFDKSNTDEYKFFKNKYIKDSYLCVGIDLNGSSKVDINFKSIYEESSAESIKIYTYNNLIEPIYSGSSKSLSLNCYVFKDPENGLDSIVQPFIVKTK